MTTERDSLIRERAYWIWERQGRPDGQDVAHWLQAEAEIAGDRPPAVATPTGKGRRSKNDETGAEAPAAAAAKPRRRASAGAPAEPAKPAPRRGKAN